MFIMGNNITCTIYCDHRTGATLRTLKTWFVLGILIVNAMYKGNGGGDHDDDDKNQFT
jgi:hypothetical protein